MHQPANAYLLLGAGGSAIAGFLHLGAICCGGPWYRRLGAGERFARMAERGDPTPALVTALIACLLLLCALYALSVAIPFGQFPWRRTVLCILTAAYLLRAMAFPFLMKRFPGNSMNFWLTSSGLCLLFGIVHLVGLYQTWDRP